MNKRRKNKNKKKRKEVKKLEMEFLGLRRRMSNTDAHLML